jgi:hypothetical protein
MDLQVAQILDPGHGENIHSNLILRCPAGASKDEVGHQRCKVIIANKIKLNYKLLPLSCRFDYESLI